MSAGQSTATSSHYERVGPFEIREEIGRGSFATVFKGYKLIQSSSSSSGNTTKLGDPVAIKAVTRKKLTRKLLDNLESEIRLLKGIKHKHVTELVDCLKTEQHIYLVMAFCPAGDLSGYLKKRGLVQGLPVASASSFPHPKEGGLNAAIVRSFLRQLST
jgi:serine/threonine-protein kinase ULK/ATG1